jgi:hypothetical protein
MAQYPLRLLQGVLGAVLEGELAIIEVKKLSVGFVLKP